MESQELKPKEEKAETAKDVALLKTEKGDIKIKLYLKEAPITAGNFKDLVSRGFYNGIGFHRIIPGFVVQGGCPYGTGTGNFEDPETNKPRYIKMEKTNFRHDKEGVVAMARTSDPDSASSQFFIDLEPLPSLDPGGVDPYGYAIFGQVIEGMDVVKTIVKENVPPFPGDDGCSNPVKIIKAEMI
ncbi:MAG: peptidylprolyl isomerase [Candidatus Caenarcaniphilales bacterium]|nr:peptidylprolyl isomerase [Candidatus Caenarcaniphilales bacterium]